MADESIHGSPSLSQGMQGFFTEDIAPVLDVECRNEQGLYAEGPSLFHVSASQTVENEESAGGTPLSLSSPLENRSASEGRTQSICTDVESIENQCASRRGRKVLFHDGLPSVF